MATETDSITKVLLSIRCMSLHIRKNASFQQGLLSSVMQLATGPQHAKNERRRLKISQSVPFELSGRPPRYKFLYYYSIYNNYSYILIFLLTFYFCNMIYYDIYIL